MQSPVAQMFVDESPDAGVVLSPEGAVLYWNQGARRTFGYTEQQALGHLFPDLVVPADRREEHRLHMADTLSAGGATYESVRRCQDGSLLYVDVSTRRLQGEPVDQPMILLVEKDVTHIKVLRDAKLMEARFRDLLESTPDGIVMANPTGHIVIANSQAELLFGYAPGELRGKSVDDLLPERYRHVHVGHRSNYFLQPRKRAMGSGLDLSGLRKDGTEFPIEISLSPLQAEESTFVMSAIRDISERKHFEKALQEKNQELASANQAKDRFLASMSHELRTPLNAIIGFTGTLLMRLPGPLTEDQEKQLRTVQGSGRHLLALINDLLDVAKIEAGKVELQVEAVDCQALLEEIAATLRPQAEAKGLDLRLEVPAQGTMLQADRRALRQIVLNLAGNAIKFTDQGSVRITLRAAEEAEDTASAGLPPATEICVEDTGEGIAPEEQGKLFRAFNRIKPRAGQVTEGTGLGLYLSQNLATLMGARILVHSVPGVGSRFTLVLRGS